MCRLLGSVVSRYHATEAVGQAETECRPSQTPQARPDWELADDLPALERRQQLRQCLAHALVDAFSIGLTVGRLKPSLVPSFVHHHNTRTYAERSYCQASPAAVSPNK